METDYKLFGKKLEFILILLSIFLILWVIGISILSQSQSITSFIPSFLGIPILVMSALIYKFPKKRRLLYNINFFFGIIIFLGGLDIIRGIIGGNAFENLWADTSKIMMVIIGLIIVLIFINKIINKTNKKK